MPRFDTKSKPNPLTPRPPVEVRKPRPDPTGKPAGSTVFTDFASL